MNLIDAALRDQERRVVEATPKEIQKDMRGGRWARIPCETKCGRTVAHSAKNRICVTCRKAQRAR